MMRIIANIGSLFTLFYNKVTALLRQKTCNSFIMWTLPPPPPPPNYLIINQLCANPCLLTYLLTIKHRIAISMVALHDVWFLCKTNLEYCSPLQVADSNVLHGQLLLLKNNNHTVRVAHFFFLLLVSYKKDTKEPLRFPTW
jgi:hypothetical protein